MGELMANSIAKALVKRKAKKETKKALFGDKKKDEKKK